MASDCDGKPTERKWPESINEEENSDPVSPSFQPPLSPVPHQDEAIHDDRLLARNKPKSGELLIKDQVPSFKHHVAQAGGPSEPVLEFGVEESGAEAGAAISDLVYGPGSSHSCFVTTTGWNMRRVIMDKNGTPKIGADGLPLTKDSPLFVVNTCTVLNQLPPKTKFMSVMMEL